MARKISITARLLTGLIVSLTVVLAAGCIVLYWVQRDMLCQEFDHRLDQMVFATVRDLAPGPNASSQSRAAVISTPNGLVFATAMAPGSGAIQWASPRAAEFLPAVTPLKMTSKELEFRTVTTATGMEVRVLMRKIGLPIRRMRERGDRGPDRREGGGPGSPPLGFEGMDEPPDFDGPDRDFPGTTSGPGPRRGRPDERVLVAGADLAPLRASLWRWVLILLVGGAVGELLVVGAVLLSVRRGLRPLRILEADIASIDDSGLEHRVPAEGQPREVQPIVQQLNGLLSRLEEAFVRERAFTASAAHEFRTPLAGIRTQIEVCLRRIRTPEEYQVTLSESLRCAISLQRTVESLFDLARLDAGQSKLVGQTIDVADVIHSQWQLVESLATARNCQAVLDVPESLPFRTDPVMFANILANVMSNAAEYGDPAGTIRISAAFVGETLRVLISNPAASLGTSDLAKLFDRFWRKDASRTNHQHCGIGLAIVERCVTAMRGRTNTRLESGQLEFEIELQPLA